MNQELEKIKDLKDQIFKQVEELYEEGKEELADSALAALKMMELRALVCNGNLGLTIKKEISKYSAKTDSSVAGVALLTTMRGNIKEEEKQKKQKEQREQEAKRLEKELLEEDVVDPYETPKEKAKRERKERRVKAIEKRRIQGLKRAGLWKE